MTSVSLEPSAPVVAAPSPRLLSLDVFRGLVICAMLIVNNLGDGATTGYFWKHADWPEPWLAESFRRWWTEPSFAQFPVFRHCTLADYVMPSFMLIIGLAIPYSAASMARRGVVGWEKWSRIVRRAAMLVLLGWILVYFRDHFANQIYEKERVAFSLGMDVLQLLGVGYLVARVAYELPKPARVVLAAALFLWHWALLRFLPQGEFPAGTFTEVHNAVGYAYSHWPVWKWITLHVGSRLTIGWIGLLSVPPAAAMMLAGTLAGDFIRRGDVADREKVRGLLVWGLGIAAAGLLWAFDLPFNKPRWTPCYLLWCAGVDFVVMAGLYYLIDIRGWRRGWTYPLVVFGSNAIAVYFLSIFVKVLVLNTPRTSAGVSWGSALLGGLKSGMGPWVGGWTFTVSFVAFWWVTLDQMYRRKWIWKV